MKLVFDNPSNISEFITNIELLVEKLEHLRIVSDTHRRWFTHKNPYGCWICDLFEISQQIGTETLKMLSPQIDKHDDSSRRSDNRYQETLFDDTQSNEYIDRDDNRGVE